MAGQRRAGRMQGTGYMAGKRKGAGVGAGGQARRRQSPKTHNHYPPPTVFLFRVGRGVMVTTTVCLT